MVGSAARWAIDASDPHPPSVIAAQSGVDAHRHRGVSARQFPGRSPGRPQHARRGRKRRRHSQQPHDRAEYPLHPHTRSRRSSGSADSAPPHTPRAAQTDRSPKKPHTAKHVHLHHPPSPPRSTQPLNTSTLPQTPGNAPQGTRASQGTAAEHAKAAEHPKAQQITPEHPRTGRIASQLPLRHASVTIPQNVLLAQRPTTAPQRRDPPDV